MSDRFHKLLEIEANIHALYTLHTLSSRRLCDIRVHYVTLHYITLLHYITSHYIIILQYNTRKYNMIQCNTSRYITVHCNTSQYITIHYKTYI